MLQYGVRAYRVNSRKAWAYGLTFLAFGLVFVGWAVSLADPAWTPTGIRGLRLVEFGLSYLGLGLRTAIAAAFATLFLFCAANAIATALRKEPLLEVTAEGVKGWHFFAGERGLGWPAITKLLRSGETYTLQGKPKSVLFSNRYIDARPGEVEAYLKDAWARARGASGTAHVATTGAAAITARSTASDARQPSPAPSAATAPRRVPITPDGFEEKVTLSRAWLMLEQVWLRFWLVLAVIGAFALVSLLGLWPMFGDTIHRVLLAAFGVGLLASLVYAARIEIPTREDAIRRIEKISEVPHRPASSYEDTLSAETRDPATSVLWDAHRKRLADLMARLTPGRPSPRADRRDPYALRGLMVIGLAALALLAGDSVFDRMASAFRLTGGVTAADARLDAWVTPPAYTGKAPQMLADGSKAGVSPGADGKTLIEVPEKSTLIVRLSGYGTSRPSLMVLADGAKEPEIVAGPEPKSAQDVVEIKYELMKPAKVQVMTGGSEAASWTFDIVEDQAPKIALTKDPERLIRGSMKLNYKITDDYGVANAMAKFKAAPAKPGDTERSWAKAPPSKAPRPPYERPPELALKLPSPSAKNGEAQSFLELGAHPWAGRRVIMTLEARDIAGKIGRSEPRELVLPQRAFSNPLARAIIEQRAKLADDPRLRPEVLLALEAFTIEPDSLFEDPSIYLNLRNAYHHLRHDETRAGRNEVVDQLWFIALKLEDGKLSDAEKNLRDAREKLSKALENGASEEEIKKLMQELKSAFNEYLNEMRKQAGNQDPQNQDGKNQNEQSMSEEDLQDMMKELEEATENGSREDAERMLSELQDLMERMQANKANPEQQRQSREMQKNLDKLSSLTGDQQKLMDDTFSEGKKQGDKIQGGQKQKGQKGQKGQPQAGEQGEPGEGQPQNNGQEGENAEEGENGERGKGQRGEKGQAALQERQKRLRQQLDDLKKSMEELGAGSEKLDGARKAMERAENALEQESFEEATEAQADALQQMREGAKEMSEQMAQNSPQRRNKPGDDPRDPLGRPQRSEGPDLGTSVKVPDQIDMQRAREILEELRKRSGEATRPPNELDYLERLLKRF